MVKVRNNNNSNSSNSNSYFKNDYYDDESDYDKRQSNQKLKRPQTRLLHYNVVKNVPHEFSIELRDKMFEEMSKYFYRVCVCVGVGDFNQINHHILGFSLLIHKMGKVEAASSDSDFEEAFNGNILDEKIREPQSRKYRPLAVRNKIFEIYSSRIDGLVEILDENTRTTCNAIIEKLTNNYDDILMKNIAKEDTGVKYQMKVYAQECYAKKLPLSVLKGFVSKFYSTKPQVEKMLLELKKQHTRLMKMPMIIYKDNKLFDDWRDNVILWWNKFARTMHIKHETNVYEYKSKHLYLYGKANSGKTTFFRFLLKPYDELDQKWMAVLNTHSNSRFQYQSFDPALYSICYFNEVNLQSDQFDTENFKLALEGEHFKTDVKYDNERTLCIQCPQLFISNYKPPIQTKNWTELQARLQVIKADTLMIDPSTGLVFPEYKINYADVLDIVQFENIETIDAYIEKLESNKLESLERTNPNNENNNNDNENINNNNNNNDNLNHELSNQRVVDIENQSVLADTNTVQEKQQEQTSLLQNDLLKQVESEQTNINLTLTTTTPSINLSLTNNHNNSSLNTLVTNSNNNETSILNVEFDKQETSQLMEVDSSKQQHQQIQQIQQIQQMQQMQQQEQQQQQQPTSNLPLSSSSSPSPLQQILSTQTSTNNQNNIVSNNSNFEMTPMTLPPSPLSLQPQVPSSPLSIRNDTNNFFTLDNLQRQQLEQQKPIVQPILPTLSNELLINNYNKNNNLDGSNLNSNNQIYKCDNNNNNNAVKSVMDAQILIQQQQQTLNHTITNVLKSNEPTSSSLSPDLSASVVLRSKNNNNISHNFIDENDSSSRMSFIENDA